MLASMVTMSQQLEGYQIQETLGIVRGITVRSRSVVGTMGAALQTIVGGNISILTSLCERTRSDAFAQMVAHAEELGANAIICVRYDATELMSGVSEVLCYGTAVHVTR